ncbi:MAG: MarR family transcriptional regulator [Chloroflexi bacterium]|nr:MarR family transcriptional regulator [Chloroflexota bacterium]
MKKQNTPDNYALWVAMTRLHYYMVKLREKELKQMGMTITQSTILAIVDQLEQLGLVATPAEISKRLLKAPSTTTELIDRMVEQGIFRRVQDLKRKNMVRIEITELGKETYEKSITVQSFAGIFTKLSPSKRASMISYLDCLLNATRKEIDLY